MKKKYAVTWGGKIILSSRKNIFEPQLVSPENLKRKRSWETNLVFNQEFVGQRLHGPVQRWRQVKCCFGDG